MSSAAPASSSSGIARIHAAFAKARVQKRCALLPFLTGGFPDLVTTRRLLRELPEAGADLVEIGFPFSDPIADGPVIAESMHRALQAGVTPDVVFELIESAAPTIPVFAMVSMSIVQRRGIERFVRQAVGAGVAGFIVPDADPQTAQELSELALSSGAGYCALVAPTTSPSRVATQAKLSTGFVYLLTRAGVTGETGEAPEIASRVALVRASTSNPIAAGFGISTREQVRAVGAHADGAIVGSAIVRAMTQAMNDGSASSSAADAALACVRALTAR